MVADQRCHGRSTFVGHAFGHPEHAHVKRFSGLGRLALQRVERAGEAIGRQKPFAGFYRRRVPGRIGHAGAHGLDETLATQVQQRPQHQFAGLARPVHAIIRAAGGIAGDDRQAARLGQREQRHEAHARHAAKLAADPHGIGKLRPAMHQHEIETVACRQIQRLRQIAGGDRGGQRQHRFENILPQRRVLGDHKHLHIIVRHGIGLGANGGAFPRPRLPLQRIIAQQRRNPRGGGIQIVLQPDHVVGAGAKRCQPEARIGLFRRDDGDGGGNARIMLLQNSAAGKRRRGILVIDGDEDQACGINRRHHAVAVGKIGLVETDRPRTQHRGERLGHSPLAADQNDAFFAEAIHGRFLRHRPDRFSRS